MDTQQLAARYPGISIRAELRADRLVLVFAGPVAELMRFGLCIPADFTRSTDSRTWRRDEHGTRIVAGHLDHGAGYAMHHVPIDDPAPLRKRAAGKVRAMLRRCSRSRGVAR